MNARLRGPLADSYLAAVALVVFALVRYLALSGAMTPLEPVLVAQLHTSKQAVQLRIGMANAAYAFGTVLAVQFAPAPAGAAHARALRRALRRRLDPRRLRAQPRPGRRRARAPGPDHKSHAHRRGSAPHRRLANLAHALGGRGDEPVHLRCRGRGAVIGGVQAGAKAWHPLYWIALGIACGGGLLALYLWVLGRARLQRADLERWEEGDEPAWRSPPLLDGIKSRDGSARLRRRVRV